MADFPNHPDCASLMTAQERCEAQQQYHLDLKRYFEELDNEINGGTSEKRVRAVQLDGDKLKIVYTDGTSETLAIPSSGGSGIKSLEALSGCKLKLTKSDNTVQEIQLSGCGSDDVVVEDLVTSNGVTTITYTDGTTKKINTGGGNNEKTVKDVKLKGEVLEVTYTDNTVAKTSLPSGGSGDSSCSEGVNSVALVDGKLRVTKCDGTYSDIDVATGATVGTVVKNVSVDETNNKLKLTYSDDTTLELALPKVVKSTVISGDKVEITYTDGTTSKFDIPCTCKNYITDLSFDKTTGDLTATYADNTTKKINIMEINMVKSVTKSGDDIIVEYDDGSKITLTDCCKSGGSSGKAVKNITLKDSTLTISYTDGSADTTVTLPTVEVVDNLTSSDTDKALSAKQGKTLKDVQDTLIKKLEVVAGSSDVKVTLADGTNYTLNLDETHFRGMYGAESDLPTTGNSEGDYADVDTNGTDVERYIWDKSDSKWVKLKGGGSSTTIVNNLTSTSTTSALSANQGKVLKDEQDKIDARVKKNVKTIENVTDKCQLKITKEDGTSTTIDLNCEPLNKAPVANDHGTIVVDQDTKDNAFTLTCTDADGDDTTVTITTEPTHGVITPVSESAGTFTYTPTKGYDGSDNFAYKCRDSKGKTSNIKTGMITVNKVSSCDQKLEIADGESLAGVTHISGEQLSIREYDNNNYLFRKDNGKNYLSVDGSDMGSDLRVIQWISYGNNGKTIKLECKCSCIVDGTTQDIHIGLTSIPITSSKLDVWADNSYSRQQRGFFSDSVSDKDNGIWEESWGRYIYSTTHAPELADGDFHAFKLDIEAVFREYFPNTDDKILSLDQVFMENWGDDDCWNHVEGVILYQCADNDTGSYDGQSEIKLSSGTWTHVNLGNPAVKT